MLVAAKFGWSRDLELDQRLRHNNKRQTASFFTGTCGYIWQICGNNVDTVSNVSSKFFPPKKCTFFALISPRAQTSIFLLMESRLLGSYMCIRHRWEFRIQAPFCRQWIDRSQPSEGTGTILGGQ
jgi:hypothetical protein